MNEESLVISAQGPLEHLQFIYSTLFKKELPRGTKRT